MFLQDLTGVDVGEQSVGNVAVECVAFGQEKMTKPLSNIGSDTRAFLGDHMYFVKNFASREELESDMVDIVVFEKKLAGLSTKEIGRTSLNLSAVYFEAEHTIQHRWLILQNKKEDFQNVKGYIKVSLNLATISDKKVELKPEEAGPGNSGSNPVEIPPSISLKSHQLKIRVIRGRDFEASTKPCLEFSLGPMVLKTSAKTGQAALWNEKLFLAVVDPSFVSSMRVRAMDSSRQVGSAQIDLKAIKAGHFKELRWVNFYGPPAGASSRSSAEFMDQNPSRGSPASPSNRLQGIGPAVFRSADPVQVSKVWHFSEREAADRRVEPQSRLPDRGGPEVCVQPEIRAESEPPGPRAVREEVRGDRAEGTRP